MIRSHLTNILPHFYFVSGRSLFFVTIAIFRLHIGLTAMPNQAVLLEELIILGYDVLCM